jgi:UDP-N-acetylmuramate--alanine ligase
MKSRQMFRGKVRRIHFVGIGGIGMSGIAEVLLRMGFEVHGSDLKPSDNIDRLRSCGAVIHVGHAAENVVDADVVVMSSAVQNENMEIRAAKRAKIPVIPRGEMLAELMKMQHGIAVAGTHGKTTTTSLISSILNETEIDPTVVIGGKVNQLGSNARFGRGGYLVAEADESDGSFARLHPTIAVVTSLDLEHVDYWTGGLQEIQEAFIQFLNRVPFYGVVILCIDDLNVQSLLPHLTRRVITYGHSKQADYRVGNVKQDSFATSFDVLQREHNCGGVNLQMVGNHNVLNSLAAVAVADELGVLFEQSRDALEKFEGVDRRFSLRGEVKGVTIIDDYGHHPTEIKTTLAGLKEAMPNRRVIALFQPHRFSRTKHLMTDFAKSFYDADIVLVTDIYGAGEDPIENVSAEALVTELRAFGHKNPRAIGALDGAVDILDEITREGDVVITLGAGDITTIGPMLVNRLEEAG